MEKHNDRSVAMTRQELLDMLKIEEAVVSTKGFHGLSRRGPFYFEPFRDSITCLNFSRETPEPCERCWLMAFVPDSYDEKAVPCHQIPMNPAGETVVTLKAEGDMDRMEQEVLKWLRGKIAELEREPGTEAKGASQSAAA
jgi:hypothetical protein